MEENKQTSKYLQYAAARKLMRDQVKVFLPLLDERPKGDLRKHFGRITNHTQSGLLREELGTVVARAMTGMLSEMSSGQG